MKSKQDLRYGTSGSEVPGTSMEYKMKFKRNLRYGMSGSDVLWIKGVLFELGYYAPSVKSVTKSSFGSDTRAAVKTFQREHVDEDGRRLKVDGVIGIRTWNAIVAAMETTPEMDLLENIGKRAAAAIAPELMRVGNTRRTLVLHALSFAYDPQVLAAYPHSLYIRGGNLYNNDGSINTITAARIRSGAKRQPQYYSNGRMEMMLEAVKVNPEITGADCSGGIVGLLRHYGLVKASFDATADQLCSNRYSASLKKSELRAGDWVGRPGHIGVYAGGGYVVEWMGGAYGCQLSNIAKRQGYSFTANKLQNKSAWTRYRRPDAY